MCCNECNDTEEMSPVSSGAPSSSSSAGDQALSYYQSLKAKICPKCSAFWVVLAIIVLYIFLKRR